MSPQEENARILNSLWSMGETAFDAMLQPIIEIVERVERRQSCARCGNFGEIAIPVGYETGEYEMVPCPECGL